MDSLLISIAVCGAFLIFAGFLARVDLSTSRWLRNNPDPDRQPRSAAADSSYHKAA